MTYKGRPTFGRTSRFPGRERRVIGSQHPGGFKRGYTLVEMIVAVIVAGVLLSVGVPRFAQSLEQSRADVAGANLRSIWSAQRLYWLQNRTYAPDLPTLGLGQSGGSLASLCDKSLRLRDRRRKR